jgi:phenylalanyl-tRNA synthetase beta chain
MKVSRAWLQKHFKEELPSTAELADALTFHAFEIESFDEDMLDVKVLPDRAGYALSHRGIAAEISAILNVPMAYDPLKQTLPLPGETDAITLSIDTPKAHRHMAALVKGVKVGPSPEWLRAALESVGQRSINNVVDATNCVTLAMGQPTHAFDAAKAGTDIGIREAYEGEKVTVLTGEEYALPEGALVLTKGRDGEPLDIAGIKGGAASGITEGATDLLLSVANFDATSIRRTARALSLWTDASLRFQNRISPELVPIGMAQLAALIKEVAGGEVVGIKELQNGLPAERLAPVTVSRGAINARLGAEFAKHEIVEALTRLDLPFVEEGENFIVSPPFWRRDIAISEDLAEEVGRILGYERIEPVELPAPVVPADQRRFRGVERVRDLLIERGFTELSTPSFAAKGEVLLANPLDVEKPYLRADLAGNMEEALSRAVTVAPRVLGPANSVRLFEIGNVFGKGGERLSLALGVKTLSGKKTALGEVAVELSELLGMNIHVAGDIVEVPLGEADLEAIGEAYEPAPYALAAFRPFSVYPSATRDVAVWSPEGTEETEVANLIIANAGDLLARIDLFDKFAKDGRVSHAFRLVFESFEKTLSDAELGPVMEKVTAALNVKEGWQVR